MPKPASVVGQNTCYAESDDGLNFVTDHVCLGTSYLRIFEWNNWYYGFGGGGDRSLWRTKNYRQPFTHGPQLTIDGEDYSEVSDNRIEKKEVPDNLIYRMRHRPYIYANTNSTSTIAMSVTFPNASSVLLLTYDRIGLNG